VKTHPPLAQLRIEAICTAVPVLVIEFHPLEEQCVVKVSTNPDWQWGVTRSCSLGHLFLGMFPRIWNT